MLGMFFWQSKKPTPKKDEREKTSIDNLFQGKKGEDILHIQADTRLHIWITSCMSRYCEYLSRILKLCVIEKQSHQPTNVYEALIEN